MRRASRWALGGWVAGLGLFILIALDQALGGPLRFADVALNDAVRSWHVSGGPAHSLGEALSLIGDWRTEAIAVVAATGWMLLRREWILAAWCLLVALCAAAVVALLKAAYARPRPPLGILHSHSFPSGHTVGAAAVLGAVLVLALETYLRSHPKPRSETLHLWDFLLVAWALLALLTAAGRILVQAHWLSDVLASLALGVALVGGILHVLAKGWHGDPGLTVPDSEPDRGEAPQA